MIRYPRRAHLLAAALLGLPMATHGASQAVAQTVVVGDDGIIHAHELGRALQTFSVFGGTPGIAAAQYYSTFNINSLQLPIKRTFAPFESSVLAGVSPYAEVTFDYLSANNVFPLPATAFSPYNVRLSFRSVSALAGAGLEFPLAEGLRLRPILLAGYSHVTGDAQFAGLNAGYFALATSGVLTDSQLDSAMLGGALELVYDKPLNDGLVLSANLRYNELAAVATTASSRAIKQNAGFGVLTGGATLSGPTEWQIAGHTLRWLAYGNGNWLPGTDKSTLGFNAYFELGGGVRYVNSDLVSGVQGATVRASALAGPGVVGWLLSAALDF